MVVFVHRDQAAIAADVADRLDGGIGCFLHRLLVPRDPVADLARGILPDEIFAGAGGGDRAVPVRRIGAGTDLRGVADAAPALARQLTGRGSGGKVTMDVARQLAGAKLGPG